MADAGTSGTSRRLLTWAAVLAVAGYFLWLSRGGLSVYFTHDDLANLSRAQSESMGAWVKANVLYFSPAYRPLGELFYRAFYQWFGMNPLPFHVVCFAVIMANIGLTYVFARAISGSRETGALVALIGCFHTNVQPLYYNAGLCFDVFCFFFYFAAFAYYIRIRKRGGLPGLWQVVVLAGLYICALNSKEMAVTLPLMLVMWEAIYHAPSSLAWITRQARTGLVLGAMTIPYVAGKFQHDSILAQIDAYRPVFTVNHYLLQFAHFLNEAFYWIDVIQARGAIAILLVSLVIAWWTGSAALRLGWLLAVSGILPVAFVSQRGLAQEGIPAMGLLIYGAVLLVWIRERLFHRAPAFMRTWSQASLFIVLGVLLARTHIRHGAWDVAWMTSEQEVSWRVAKQLQANHPVLRKGARVLVLSDPFVESQFALASTILIELYHRDPDLEITRLTAADPRPDKAAMQTYDWVVSLE